MQRVRITRANGEKVEGVIGKPVPWLLHIGEFYEVRRPTPLRQKARKVEGRDWYYPVSHARLVDCVTTDYGLYAKDQLEVIK